MTTLFLLQIVRKIVNGIVASAKSKASKRERELYDTAAYIQSILENMDVNEN